MKSVLFVALLATLSSVQAGHAATENDCASRPYVGVCPDADFIETAKRPIFESKTPAPDTNCSTHPYVGVCDPAAED